MPDFELSKHNRVRRGAHRADYSRETVYTIVDEALYCNVGFVVNGQPYVIPSNHARMDDKIILHGSTVSRMLASAGSGAPLCVTFTLLDGLVLARSVFSHSVNYRSAVVFGVGKVIRDDAEKLAALEAITEHIMPGRWADARQPTAKELAATAVVSVTIESASAKVRSGPPLDNEEDHALDVWAGELPIRSAFGQPVAEPHLNETIEVPSYISTYWRSQVLENGENS